MTNDELIAKATAELPARRPYDLAALAAAVNAGIVPDGLVLLNNPTGGDVVWCGETTQQIRDGVVIKSFRNTPAMREAALIIVAKRAAGHTPAQYINKA